MDLGWGCAAPILPSRFVAGLGGIPYTALQPAPAGRSKIGAAQPHPKSITVSSVMRWPSLTHLFGLFVAVASMLSLVTSPLCAQNPPQVDKVDANVEQPIDDSELGRMIGQMVMVGFVGADPGADGYRTVIAQAKEGKITGVLYLGRNISTLKQVRHLNEELQSASPVPLLIAIDQEGGRIQRLTNAVGFKEIQSAAEVAERMDPEQAEELYAALASALFRLGFNLNLGPVVDLNINPANPIIGKLDRSFSSDPNKVTAFARAFVTGHRAHHVLTALKHFPGHGSSKADSHKGIVDITATWDEKELLPYKDLIKEGPIDLVMSAHVMNGKLSSQEGVPSSLSPRTLTGLLRDKLQFQGVIISDDMQMQAIVDGYKFDEAVRFAVLAGTDILVFANDKHPDPQIPEKIAALLTKEARKDPDMLDRIRQSYRRIMDLKQRLARGSVSKTK